jgi:hypothetical protein
MKELPNIASDSDVIIRYLHGKENVLNAVQQLKLKRWASCKQTIFDHVDKMKVIKYHARDWNISEETAIADYEATLLVFNTKGVQLREFWIEFALSSINRNITEARASKDFATVAKENKNILLLIEKFFGNEEKPDYSKLQPVDITIGFFPDLTGIKLPPKDELDKIVMNLQMIKKEKEFDFDSIEDAESEEVE